MTIQIQVSGPYQTNTYILGAKNSLIVIDPVDVNSITSYAKKHNKNVAAVLLTHTHWDHVGAAVELQKNGAKVYMHELEQPYSKNGELPFGKVIADYLFSKDETLNLDGIKIDVIHTGGHTKGSVCYVAGKSIFSGDTLFKGEVGRCDLAGGSFAELKKSLQKLFMLKGDYTVYSGHGESSTLDFERKFNPYA